MNDELKEALSEVLGCNGPDPWGPKGTSDEMINRLVVENSDFNRTTAFPIGRFITPKKHSGKKGRGRPYIVVESFPRKIITDEYSRPVHYTDLVLGVMLEGKFTLYQGYSAQYEPFDEAKVK